MPLTEVFDSHIQVEVDLIAPNGETVVSSVCQLISLISFHDPDIGCLNFSSNYFRTDLQFLCVLQAAIPAAPSFSWRAQTLNPS